MLRKVASIVALCACVLTHTALATVIAPVPFDTLVLSADMVFRGAVAATEARWIDTGNGRAIVTRVTFRVDRMLRGAPQSEVTLEFIGGRIGDRELQVDGVPRFVIGQRDVICARAGNLQVSPVTGFNQGRFPILRDVAGRDFVTAYDGRPVTSLARTGSQGLISVATAGQSMATTLDNLEEEILRVQSAPR
jgi:hypothetical protein